jgi:hypothetical protein
MGLHRKLPPLHREADPPTGPRLLAILAAA